MNYLRAGVVYIWAAIVMALAYPCVFLARQWRARGQFARAHALIHHIAHPFAKSICFLAGAKIEIRGLEHIPQEGPVLLIGNHQSYFDIPVLVAAVPRSVGFVAKDNLAGVPLLAGWTLALPSVFIPRGESRKALETVLEAAQILKNEDHALVLFPEGTRTNDGTVAPYKAGGFKIGTRSGASIIPFVIDGNWRLMPRTTKTFCPGKVTVTFFAPLNADKRSDTIILANQCHALAEETLQESV